MKAVWSEQVIAEAGKDLIHIEGKWSPAHERKVEVLGEKVTCCIPGLYPEPLPSAIERVHKVSSGYVAFWRDVLQITE